MKQMETRSEESGAPERMEAPGPRQEVPSAVNDRILKRILVFSGIPTVTGFLLLPLFYYLKVRCLGRCMVQFSSQMRHLNGCASP